MVMGADMRAEEGLNVGGSDGGPISGLTPTIRERTRIYVGGLGESVTADDLRKTFSTLGNIESVDILRTKGRSFAYLDFIPFSDKSLPKLFSTYNGCMWKGGRLRLEKAKEHYLIRMKREWEEEAENASDASKDDVDVSERTISLVKPKKGPSSDNKMQLQIFFPKLRKVKSVAFSGTGKHKYSFQRIDIPALPRHFCNCEEHYVPPITKAKHSSNLEAANGGINEEELNIMNSVMNRLLKKEDFTKTEVNITSRRNINSKESNSPNERDSSDKSIDDELVGDEGEEMTNEEDNVTDEDDMIINVVTRGNNRVEALERQSLEAIMAEQKSIAKKLQTSKVKPPQNISDSHKRNSDSHKRNSLPSCKKQKPSDAEEIVINVGKSSQLPLTTLTTPGNKALGLELSTQEVKSTSPRKQKSTCKNLIDKKVNPQFSLTDIIQGATSQKKEEFKIADVDEPSITNKNEKNPNSVKRDEPSKTDEEEGELQTVDLDSVAEMKSQSTENHGDGEIRAGQSANLEYPAEGPSAKLKEVADKVARGASWRAKSSWTQLVSTTINAPFSLSHVLPISTSAKHDEEQQYNAHVVNSVRNEVSEDHSDASGFVNKDVIIASNPSPSVMIPLVKHDNNPASLGSEQKFTEEKLKEKSYASASSVEKTQPLTSKQRALGEFEFSETCPFMRTDASMKEWRKRKAAESTSLRKKKKGDSV